MSKRIAIFASGVGSNTQCIIEYFQKKEGASVVLVLCNKPKALVLNKARSLGVETFVFNKEALTSVSAILNKLSERKVDLIVLAGFLLKIPPSLIQAYPGRIINMHPALLPKFGGKGMYGMHVHQAVVDAGESESGISIHYVNEQYDEGSIIFQASCMVAKHDRPADVAEKIRRLEQQHFPAVIEQLIKTV